MKRTLIVLSCAFLLTSCNGWFFQPSGNTLPTPFRPPTRTPSIVTATPAGAVTSTPLIATSTVALDTPAVVDTSTSPVLSTDTLIPVQSMSVEVLGCNTSLDITHGLGEVTNAFVLLKNTGNMELTNLRATLYALDEGQEHPDKTVEITSLPAAYQVTLKLTVDSTYREETPIQVEVFGDGGLFQRVGESACPDLGLTSPNPEGLNTPIPF